MMKRWISLPIVLLVIFWLAGCGKSDSGLSQYTMSEDTEYSTITYDEKVYVPYCVVDKQDCGDKIGIVDNDTKHCVYTYKDWSSDEWIIDMIDSGLMDNPMLWRELSVTSVPEGLESEYEWNDLKD